jgi:hypothetical protein
LPEEPNNVSTPNVWTLPILFAFSIFYIAWRIAVGVLRALGDILRLFALPLLWPAPASDPGAAAPAACNDDGAASTVGEIAGLE